MSGKFEMAPFPPIYSLLVSFLTVVKVSRQVFEDRTRQGQGI